jgi:hypothetical protein
VSEMRWSVLLETMGGVAIVASLIFVGLQMRQDQVIARSELAAAGFENFAVVHQTMIDPEFAVVWAKTLESPKDLSVDEMLRVNGFLNVIAEVMARECYLKEREIYVECDNAIRDQIRRYFGNTYAQTWWRLSDTRPVVALPEWVDAEIASIDVASGRKRLEMIRAEL